MEKRLLFVSLFALLVFFNSGNKNLIAGFNNFVSLSINVVSCTIFINPFHKHIVPKNAIDNSTALSAESNIDLFTFSKFPTTIAYPNEIIINTGHIIFNIPFLILSLYKYYSSVHINILFWFLNICWYLNAFSI